MKICIKPILTKNYISGSSVLALKKNVRRSSFLDKSVRTIKNEQLLLVENSSSISTKSSSNNSLNSYKVINDTPIIISDTVSSESDDSEKQRNEDEKNQHPTNSCLLSSEKIKEINLWIDHINEEKGNETKFSELSTINGEEGCHFQAKEKGNAVSSTLIGTETKRLDEFFKYSSSKNDESDFSGNDFKESLKMLIIEDSLENSKRDIEENPQPSSKGNSLENNSQRFSGITPLSENGQLQHKNSTNKTPTCTSCTYFRKLKNNMQNFR